MFSLFLNTVMLVLSSSIVLRSSSVLENTIYIIVYYSIGFTDSASKFWRQISKSWRGSFDNLAQNFNAGFIKLTLYNIFLYIFCLMFLIDAIKLNIEKKFKKKIFLLFRGGESRM